MRTLPLCILCCACLWGTSLLAQVSGKLFIGYTQNITGLADSIGYYNYPGGDFTAVASFSARDMATASDQIFCAPTPGPGGRYDSLQSIHIPTDQVFGKVPGDFTVGNVEVWNNKLVVSCGEAPYLRVIGTSSPYAEDFHAIDDSELPKNPFGLSVYQDMAYVWTDSLLVAVNLNTEQIISSIDFPAGFLVQSEFNAVLGAADSAYLLVSMGRNTNARDTVHVYHINLSQSNLEYRDQYLVTGLLAFPGVSAGDLIHFSRYRAYYDARSGTIVPDMLGQTFLPGQASSYDPRSQTLVVMEEASFNRQFLWFESADTILNPLTPLMLPDRTVIVWSSLFISDLPAVSLDPVSGFDFALYPNPARTSIHIKSREASSYSISDLRGRMLVSGEISNEATTINISELAAGTYICTVFSDEKGPLDRKFVKW